jgi:hypothetical protein
MVLYADATLLKRLSSTCNKNFNRSHYEVVHEILKVRFCGFASVSVWAHRKRRLACRTFRR